MLGLFKKKKLKTLPEEATGRFIRTLIDDELVVLLVVAIDPYDGGGAKVIFPDGTSGWISIDEIEVAEVSGFCSLSAAQRALCDVLSQRQRPCLTK